jgi:hypothetical protein
MNNFSDAEDEVQSNEGPENVTESVATTMVHNSNIDGDVAAIANNFARTTSHKSKRSSAKKKKTPKGSKTSGKTKRKQSSPNRRKTPKGSKTAGTNNRDPSSATRQVARPPPVSAATANANNMEQLTGDSVRIPHIIYFRLLLHSNSIQHSCHPFPFSPVYRHRCPLDKKYVSHRFLKQRFMKGEKSGKDW